MDAARADHTQERAPGSKLPAQYLSQLRTSLASKEFPIEAATLAHKTSTRHVASLDGVRTLAILVVLLFHAGARRFEAGWIGVDLFFALSGFPHRDAADAGARASRPHLLWAIHGSSCPEADACLPGLRGVRHLGHVGLVRQRAQYPWRVDSRCVYRVTLDLHDEFRTRGRGVERTGDFAALVVPRRGAAVLHFLALARHRARRSTAATPDGGMDPHGDCARDFRRRGRLRHVPLHALFSRIHPRPRLYPRRPLLRTPRDGARLALALAGRAGRGPGCLRVRTVRPPCDDGGSGHDHAACADLPVLLPVGRLAVVPASCAATCTGSS